MRYGDDDDLFLKPHWFVLMAERGFNPLHFYGDGGDDGGGGGDDDDDDDDEPIDFDPTDPGMSLEVQEAAPATELTAEEAAALGLESGTVEVNANDPGSALEAGGSVGGGPAGDLGGALGDTGQGLGGFGGFGGYGAEPGAPLDPGAPVDPLTELQDQALGLAPETSFGFTGGPTGSPLGGFGLGPTGPVDPISLQERDEKEKLDKPEQFVDWNAFTGFGKENRGPEFLNALDPTVPPGFPQEKTDQQKVDEFIKEYELQQQQEKERQEQPVNTGPFAQATSRAIGRDEVVGAKDVTTQDKDQSQFANPPGLVGVPIGPVGPQQAGAQIAGAVPIDDPRGDFVGTRDDIAAAMAGQPGQTAASLGQTGSFAPGFSPTDVAFGYGPNASYGQTVASAPVTQEIAQASPGTREVGTTSYTQDKAGNIIETPTSTPTSIPSQPTGPIAAGAIPSATGLLTDPLSGPPTGRDPWESNREASQRAAPDPNAPQAPSQPREPNALENFTGQLADYLGGQQTGGMDPGADVGLGGGEFKPTRQAASPVLAAADTAATTASPLTTPQPQIPPGATVNPTPYTPAQPALSSGQYQSSGFDTVPERSLPAGRIPRDLRDQIAAAMLAQMQDRLSA